MFIFDLDDTLVGAHKLKEIIRCGLAEIGVSKELVEETYKKARSNGIETSYSFKKHAKILTENGFEENVIVKKLEEEMKKIKASHYLEPGAIELLSWLKENKKKLILVSLGDPEFQKIKIKNAGLENYFDEIVFTKNSKEEAIVATISDKTENVWLVNDKVEESVELKDKYGQLQVLLKVSPTIPAQKYEQSGFPYFQTLIEIKEYVTRQI